MGLWLVVRLCWRLISSMAEGIVGGMAALYLGNGKRSSEPGSNPNANSSSGSNGDKSGPPCKISGTRNSFNVKGVGSAIEAEGGSINSGYCSGFADAKRAAPQDHDPLEECSGTDQSFNVEAGGKIIIGEGNICSGAFSCANKAGTSMPRSFRGIEPR